MTEEDKLWEEDSANVNEETNRERRAAQAAITELNRANEEAMVSSSTETLKACPTSLKEVDAAEKHSCSSM